jgi:predicted enzyme related to lactoylglutathione lyase
VLRDCEESRASRKRRPPVVHIGWITVDCIDPDRLATFWSTLLGVGEDFRIGEPAQYVMLQAGTTGAVPLEFQRVPEPRQVKNRLHLDLTVEDLGQAAVLVKEAGGVPTPSGDFEEAGYLWKVMADPEGNEFCLVQRAR